MSKKCQKCWSDGDVTVETLKVFCGHRWRWHLERATAEKKKFSSVPLPFLTVFLLRLLYRLQMQQQFFMAMIRANIAILSTTVAQTPTNASGSTYILT